MTNSHVNIYIANTTAVAYINAMGGTQSLSCNKVARDIWTWCMVRELWVSAISLPCKKMLMQTGNLEHLMITLSGLSMIMFSITYCTLWQATY